MVRGDGRPVASRGSWSALRAALIPLPGPWGVGPGLRAAAVAGVVLGGSVLVADLRVGGIAYLGVACAVSFVGRGDYRSRAAMVGGQAAGACVGLTAGALVPNMAALVITASVVLGVVAGMVGRVGPASTSAAVMAVIGFAYTQFGRLAMPWWEPVLAYAVGSALLLAVSLVGALAHRDRYRTGSVAAVFDRAADLLESPPGTPADNARHLLAAASAAARAAVGGYRIRPVTGPLADAWSEARDAAARAAQVVVDTEPPASETLAELSGGWRARAADLRAGAPRQPGTPSVPAGPPLSTRMRIAISAATDIEALWVGARIGLCVGAATALAILLHPPQHAFWIPLTVAVVLRPEYGAVLVRSVHRFVGTLAGVVVVAVLTAATSSPAWLSLAAALALGLAALSAPRLYGLAVVGITGSALFSIAVGDPHDLEPWLRLLDTFLGCAIALVAGVVLWPRRGLPDQPRAFGVGVAALARQIDLELASDGERSSREAVTDEAYRTAHAWRAELERDLAEPDPARAAEAWLPVAMQLERTTDAVCAAGARVRDDAGLIRAERRAELADLLHGPLGHRATPAQALDLLAAVRVRLIQL